MRRASQFPPAMADSLTPELALNRSGSAVGGGEVVYLSVVVLAKTPAVPTLTTAMKRGSCCPPCWCSACCPASPSSRPAFSTTRLPFLCSCKCFVAYLFWLSCGLCAATGAAPPLHVLFPPLLLCNPVAASRSAPMQNHGCPAPSSATSTTSCLMTSASESPTKTCTYLRAHTATSR